jgi:hypothetical protein
MTDDTNHPLPVVEERDIGSSLAIQRVVHETGV